MILFHFTGEITGDSLKIVEDEIIDSKWIKVSELKNFDNNELREANVIRQIMDSLLNQKVYSITVFNEQLCN